MGFLEDKRGRVEDGTKSKIILKGDSRLRAGENKGENSSCEDKTPSMTTLLKGSNHYLCSNPGISTAGAAIFQLSHFQVTHCSAIWLFRRLKPKILDM